ncbi:tyrosine-type recombinase/integrase [Candidatus Woesearchaeota archaeon]|nr:tyrosine-type recombinase/integrase [Candidatus Woesearchaeota archaeon]
MSNKNKLPDVLSVEQLVRIFDFVEDPKIAIATALTFFCGLRISEICKLKVEDIDLENKRLKVVDSKFSMRTKTKYGKDRYVIIPDMMINPIKRWLDIIQGGKWFLPSDKTPNSHMRPKSLGEKFKIVLKNAGLLMPMYELNFKQRINGKWRDKKVYRHKYHFHTLRHSYATYLHSKGVDIYTISDLLGHNQVTTTQIYARISDSKRKEAIDRAFNLSLSSRVINAVPQALPNHASEELERLRLEIKNKELELRKLELMKNISQTKSINYSPQLGNHHQAQPV